MLRKSKYMLLPILVLVPVLLIALPANATLMSVSGPVSSLGVNPAIISAPTDVTDDFPPGAENEGMQGFDERQSVTLTDPIITDQGTIGAQTVVNSHMIFFNTPYGYTSTHNSCIWTFDGDILGVMSDSWGDLEVASSDILGAAGTIYPAVHFNARGLEGGDSYTFSGNTITVTMSVSEPGDWMRVVTAAESVPEPATMFLFGFGLLGLAGLRRKFRKR